MGTEGMLHSKVTTFDGLEGGGSPTSVRVTTKNEREPGPRSGKYEDGLSRASAGQMRQGENKLDPDIRR